MTPLVCALYYREGAPVDIRGRDDWMAAPFRDLQIIRRGPGFVVESLTPRVVAGRDTPSKWHHGEHFWMWRPDEPRPFAGDWMELGDYLSELGVLDRTAPLLSVSLADIEAAGVKYGLNLSNEEWSALYTNAKADYEAQR